MNFLESGGVLLLRKLLIEETIFLVRQIHAPKATLATATGEQKFGFRTRFTVLTPHQPITMFAIDAFVTELAVEDEEAVDQIRTPMDVHGVVTVFVVVGGKDQIAIPVAGREVRVFAVVVLRLKVHRAHRTRKQQFSKLLKKRPREIEIPAVVERIPLVGIPLAMIVDGVRRFRRVYREDLLSREAAFPVIEPLLIAPCEPAAHTALRTKSWRRDVVALSCKDRGNFFVEAEISLSDLKFRRALLAGLHD